MTSTLLSLLRPSARRSVVCAAMLTCSLSLCNAAFAQSRPLATADIPFAFAAGGKVLPAGHYTFVRLSSNIYALSGSDGKTVQQITVFAGDSPTNAKASVIRFHHYGSSYFLRGAWFGNVQTGIELMKGKAEKELQASTKLSQPSGIVLALNTGVDR